LAATSARLALLQIFGDDIGWFNLSAYNMGMMGCRTPNIDRIAHGGMLFASYTRNRVARPDVR
jgi:arylsulfatase